MQHYNIQFKVKSSSYTLLDYHSLPQEQSLQDFRGLSFLSLKWQSNVLHESTNLKQHLSINMKQRPGFLGKGKFMESWMLLYPISKKRGKVPDKWESHLHGYEHFHMGWSATPQCQWAHCWRMGWDNWWWNLHNMGTRILSITPPSLSQHLIVNPGNNHC